MLSLFHAGILGIVEGITEFLPISSTAHLILASQLLRLPDTDFMKSFEIIIQLGAILAVMALYWRSFLRLEVLKRLIIAFIPTGVIGLSLYKVVKTYLLGSTSIVLWALLLGGLILIAFERFHQESALANEEIDHISYKQCLAIGLFQSIAIIPGVSRSAATIVGGLLLGLKRKTIVEFSFLLAVPTMAAATGLDLLKNASRFSADQTSFLLVGFVTSFVLALASIKWLLSYVQKHSFTVFGVYRVIVALVFWIA